MMQSFARALVGSAKRQQQNVGVVHAPAGQGFGLAPASDRCQHQQI
jgi:hypothetical protein